MSTRQECRALVALRQLRKKQNSNKKQVLEDVAVIVNKNPVACRESVDNNPSCSRAIVDLLSPSNSQQALKHTPEFEKSTHKTPLESQYKDTNSKQLPSLKAQSPGPSNRKNALDKYNSPSTSKTENFVDGIVPLKLSNNASKFISTLKSDIISDNVEVLFDPIVPLPSSTKVRQKLHPVPRQRPTSRNSMTGSESESEEESRRGLQGGSSTPMPPTHQRNYSHTSHSTMQSQPTRDVSRAKNDPLSSYVTQMSPPGPAVWEPPIEDYAARMCRLEVRNRIAAMRSGKYFIPREHLTMYHLIFQNPLSNPIVPEQDELIAKAAAIRDEEERKNQEKTKATNDSVKNTAAPVPQVKLGPNGDIIIDEESLVVKQSDQRQISDTVVREGPWTRNTSRVHRRRRRTAKWSDGETVRFYLAMASLGTDFSVMTPLFPGRDRRDLKLKFKKEERTNPRLVEKALRSPTEFDMDRLEIEFAEQREAEKEEAERKKQQLIEFEEAEREHKRALSAVRGRKSMAQKIFGASVLPESPVINADRINTADQFLQKYMASKKRNKKIAYETELEPEISETTKPVPNVGIPYLDSTTPIIRPPTPTPTKLLTPIATSKPVSTWTEKLLTPMATTKPVSTSPVKSLLPTTTLNESQPVLTPSIKPTPQKSPVALSPMPSLPADIEPGSLVLLTVDDPTAPSQKAIHTYIKQADGRISPVVLDPSAMSTIISYLKNGTPKAAGSSSSTMSPSSVVSDTTNKPPALAYPRPSKIMKYS